MKMVKNEVEENQDMYDESEAVSRGVITWKATPAEVDGRNPEDIVQTRHWQAADEHPPESLFKLWEDLGFNMIQQAWDRNFQTGALHNTSPMMVITDP